MAANRPFATKPSRDLLFIKLWAATLRMPEMEKACQKISKWPSLRPLALNINDIILQFEFFFNRELNKFCMCMEKLESSPATFFTDI